MKTSMLSRLTGAAYLGIAVTGMLGFLLVRPALYDATDATTTLRNLTEQSALAHTGLVLELLIAIAQALAALGFFALFQRDRPGAAFGVAAFGVANAVTILLSAVFIAAALVVSGDPSLAPAGDAAATVQLLYALSGGCWSIGGLFFGLWLIPMGWFLLSTRRAPRVLGWFLIVGGVGYLLGTLVGAVSPDLKVLADLLPLPATVGEFWMIGYLLVRGLRPSPAGVAG
jgi:hypothetical protein